MKLFTIKPLVDAISDFIHAPNWHIIQRHKMGMHWYHMCSYYGLQYESPKFISNSLRSYYLGWTYYLKYYTNDRKHDIVLSRVQPVVDSSGIMPRHILLLNSRGPEIKFSHAAVAQKIADIANNIHDHEISNA